MDKTELAKIESIISKSRNDANECMSGNLLEAFVAKCRGVAASTVSRRLADGHVLRRTSKFESRWIGHRIVWCSPGRRFTRSRSVVSSRLGTKLDHHDALFLALRTLVLGTHARQEQFIVSQGCAIAPYVCRCAELFGRSVLRIRMPKDNTSFEGWMEAISSKETLTPNTIYLSPRLSHNGDADLTLIPTPIAEVPARDRAQFAFANQITALNVRRGGFTGSLLRQAMSDKHFKPGSIRVNVDTCDKRLTDELLSQGAVGLHNFGEHKNEPAFTDDQSNEIPATIINVADVDDQEYLGHWTRRQKGAWPDQACEEFEDELLLGLPTKDRSPLASLARIVAQRRLLATSGSNRSKTSVVSFTSVPLKEWTAHRRFQAHRTRWDFEPYGVCIRRPWLEELGIQPVIYGDESTWTSLDGEQQHLFQLARSTTATGKSIDWTSEREFRCIGNIELDRAGRHEVLIVVPTHEEARHVANISPWPIVVLAPP